MQIISCSLLQVMVSNSNIKIHSDMGYFKYGRLMVAVGLVIVFASGLNNYANVFLSQITWSKMSL